MLSAAALAALLAAAAVWTALPVDRGTDARAGPLRWATVALGVLLLLGLVVRPSPARLALAVVLGGAAHGALLLRRRLRARGEMADRRVLVQGFCEELAGGLAAGLPVGAALDGAVGGWAALDGVAATQRMGGSVPEALRQLARSPGASDLRLVAASWQVAHRSGASLAAALDTVSATVREHQRTRRMVASELASARATARLMAGLPVFTLAMGSGAGGDPVGFLLTTPLGIGCLAAGLVLTLLGLWWIEGIAGGIESDVR